MSLRTRRSDGGEEGWVLVTTLVILALLVSLSFSLLSIVDVQTGQSRQQRTRETAFNVAEAGLNAEIFSLGRDWPGAASRSYANCPGGPADRCPSDAQLSGLIPTADMAGGTWGTEVRDNGPVGAPSSFYSDSVPAVGWDANGDGQLWVRATSTVKGRTRTMVALVRAQQQEEDIPHAAIISGRLDITNDGNKIIVDATAGAGSPTAAVRCTPALLESTPCLGQRVGLGSILSVPDLLSFLGRQLSPNVTQTAYAGGAAMTAEARARLKATAIADDTYYNASRGCPTTLTGHIVYIDGLDCSYTGNETYNTDAQPGMVLVASGSVYLGGTSIYHGVIYDANLGAPPNTVAVQIQGNAQVVGGVLLDGDATLRAGSSQLNIRFDPSAFRAVSSYGSAGIVQNTWREIKG